MSDKENEQDYRWLLWFLLVTLLVGLTCYVWLNQSSRTASNEAVTEMSTIYLQELSIQKIGYLQTSISDQLSRLKLMAETVTEKDLASEEALEAFLRRLQEDNGFALLALLDDQGYYHSADGVYPAAGQISALDTLPDGQELVSYGETVSGDNMLLLGTPIAAVSYGDGTFSAIVAGYGEEDLTSQLSLSMDNARAHATIYTTQGQLVARCSHEDNMDVGQNLFTGLERFGTFLSDTDLSALHQAFQNGQSGLVICDIRSQTQYLYYAPIPNTDWVMVMSIAYDVMDATIGTFGQKLNRDAILIMVAVMAALLALFLVYSYGMNRARAATNEARQQAEAASHAKSEFLSHMSHDIRTPINGILGMTAIARKSMDDPQRVADCIDKIAGASDHLLSLVNDVLDMSRIESGKIAITHQPMNLPAFLDGCASIISGQLLSRDLTFQCRFEPFDHPHLLADELHMRQALINILGNAVKFTPDGGTILFSAQELRSDGEQALFRFTVSDTGIGMSPEFIDKIFDAFSQEDDGSRTHYKGTGLGMSITKQFIDLMGGTITVDSQLNRGSCFTVELPLLIDHSISPTQDALQHREAIDLTGMHVLLVEDNELNLEIAQELLTDEGAVVTTAMNGRAAVNIFLASPPGTFQVILMDVMMPVMNGYEATGAIRASAHPDAASVPILAMTANAYEEDVRRALNAGMNAHIAKPINVDHFLSLLAQYRT
jgi:signal transduction histidine kinase